MPHNFPILAKAKASTPITLLTEKTFPTWLKKQALSVKNWLSANDFSAKVGAFISIPDTNGKINQVIAIIEETPNIWSIAHLPAKLPAGIYSISETFEETISTNLALGWSLATYEFLRYKKSSKKFAQLIAPKNANISLVESFFGAICWARDLINTPANDMNPETLADEAIGWAKAHKAKISVITGEELLKQNYQMIYEVGKAAEKPPRLVDIRFARKNAPKITIVGKGVTFDSGGLDIKPSSGMKLMKKDMGGAANALALARVIVEMGLPVQLRVLLPIVENAVAGNAMRPLDIIATRKGINVEIGNTDAEGRLILCDALFEADSEAPDLLIDCATLTGAARVALGAEIPAFFTNDDTLAHELYKACKREHDPLWRLPLWAGYREQLNTDAAELSNDPDSSYGGAITAALYLQEFVSKTNSWLHIDMMAWNLKTKAGQPIGGEAMGVRALYNLINEKFGIHKKNGN